MSDIKQKRVHEDMDDKIVLALKKLKTKHSTVYDDLDSNTSDNDDTDYTSDSDEEIEKCVLPNDLNFKKYEYDDDTTYSSGNSGDSDDSDIDDSDDDIAYSSGNSDDFDIGDSDIDSSNDADIDEFSKKHPYKPNEKYIVWRSDDTSMCYDGTNYDAIITADTKREAILFTEALNFELETYQSTGGRLKAGYYFDSYFYTDTQGIPYNDTEEKINLKILYRTERHLVDPDEDSLFREANSEMIELYDREWRKWERKYNTSLSNIYRILYPKDKSFIEHCHDLDDGKVCDECKNEYIHFDCNKICTIAVNHNHYKCFKNVVDNLKSSDEETMHSALIIGNFQMIHHLCMKHLIEKYADFRLSVEDYYVPLAFENYSLECWKYMAQRGFKCVINTNFLMRDKIKKLARRTPDKYDNDNGELCWIIMNYGKKQSKNYYLTKAIKNGWLCTDTYVSNVASFLECGKTDNFFIVNKILQFDYTHDKYFDNISSVDCQYKNTKNKLCKIQIVFDQYEISDGYRFCEEFDILKGCCKIIYNDIEIIITLKWLHKKKKSLLYAIVKKTMTLFIKKSKFIDYCEDGIKEICSEFDIKI